ncbi:type II toxin-antitoxin system RelE/ParE family toxin [Lacibacter sp.]|uniref:type II toxin-antitoxin system RelE family toxin n=1 Tax=Lacibacter sp. TaxID=1915409 RepID=UPI002B4B231D|nr:type II toxin-antitoxin system RelE/ParE family toxin [Lacibacter sp.]HLP35612.1 type II toxin-antitoxin system RelE/ParE family toxin [Lacibacter sp.]
MSQRSYTVIITKTVQKTLSKLSDRVASKLEAAMLSLEENPRPNGCKKLKGREAYRIREGNYRIIYEIEDKILRVLVLDVGHRRDIYD